MNYKRLLRVGSTVVETVEPRVVDDESTYLTDDEVEYIMTRLKHLQEEYFLDLPLASSLKHAKKFLYNIPKNVFNLIKKVDEEQPDSLLSPLFMIYPLLTTGIGIETQRVYLERISYSIKDEGDDDGDE
jgi:hypothetical protein